MSIYVLVIVTLLVLGTVPMVTYARISGTTLNKWDEQKQEQYAVQNTFERFSLYLKENLSFSSSIVFSDLQKSVFIEDVERIYKTTPLIAYTADDITATYPFTIYSNDVRILLSESIKSTDSLQLSIYKAGDTTPVWQRNVVNEEKELIIPKEVFYDEKQPPESNEYLRPFVLKVEKSKEELQPIFELKQLFERKAKIKVRDGEKRTYIRDITIHSHDGVQNSDGTFVNKVQW